MGHDEEGGLHTRHANDVSLTAATATDREHYSFCHLYACHDDDRNGDDIRLENDQVAMVETESTKNKSRHVFSTLWTTTHNSVVNPT